MENWILKTGICLVLLPLLYHLCRLYLSWAFFGLPTQNFSLFRKRVILFLLGSLALSALCVPFESWVLILGLSTASGLPLAFRTVVWGANKYKYYRKSKDIIPITVSIKCYLSAGLSLLEAGGEALNRPKDEFFLELKKAVPSQKNKKYLAYLEAAYREGIAAGPLVNRLLKIFKRDSKLIDRQLQKKKEIVLQAFLSASIPWVLVVYLSLHLNRDVVLLLIKYFLPVSVAWQSMGIIILWKITKF